MKYGKERKGSSGLFPLPLPTTVSQRLQILRALLAETDKMSFTPDENRRKKAARTALGLLVLVIGVYIWGIVSRL